MFRKLDAYIIKKFLTTFFLAIAFIIGIVIIFDISEKIEKFVANEAPLHAIVFDYYLNFIPYFMNMFSPLFVFITVIFFTSKMAQNTEIVAILSCGISYHRMMVPYMFSALLIAILSLCLNLFVIPQSNKVRTAFENQYVKGSGSRQSSSRNIHYQISEGEFVFVESFSSYNNTAYKFTLETIEDGKIKSKVSAERAQYDTLSGKWTLKNYFIRNYNATLDDDVVMGDALDTMLAITVKDFNVRKNMVETLTQKELDEYISTLELRGDPTIKNAKIEKYQRFSLPFSAFILTIIGVSLSSQKRRGGIGWNIAIGIALSFSYILFMRFSEMFVFTDTLPVALAIWLPNILFTGIAAFLYRIAPK